MKSANCYLFTLMIAKKCSYNKHFMVHMQQKIKFVNIIFII